MRRIQVMFFLAGIALVYGGYRAFTAPLDNLQGEFTRMIYVHVPTLWLAFLAFGITALGSIGYLITKKQRWDSLAGASAEIGVLYAIVGVFTGMVWGQAVWGQAWDWGDARLRTTAVMIFVYLAYLALRRSIADPVVRAKRAAILGTVAVIQVPLVYFSVNLVRTLHQTQSIRPDGSTMPTEILLPMLINLGAFTILYVALMMARIYVGRLEAARSVSTEIAGDAVSPPRLSDIQDV
jgi:heme exporter protein C